MLQKSRYFIENESSTKKSVKKLNYCVNGQWLESKATKYMDCYNPSTGEVIAMAPQCTSEEVESAIHAAKAAFPGLGRHPRSANGFRFCIV